MHLFAFNVIELQLKMFWNYFLMLSCPKDRKTSLCYNCC